jgi:hypothetical protein
MARIEDILHRRTDLSTFLVHLTRSHDPMTARERFEAILEDRVLLAGSPMGWAAEEDEPNDPDAQSQRVVCFSETPLEHAWTFIENIEGRQVKLKPYGVALPKFRARQLGVNPVWYVDMTPGRDWRICEALNELWDEAAESGDFHAHPASRLFPFIEGMGDWRTTSGHRREFWWEREWRHVGDLHLPDLGTLFLCPEDEIDDFLPREDGESRAKWNRRKRRFIDPRWGLERIIAHLAGMPREYITPFDS